MIARILAIAFAFIILAPGQARAQCSNPAGNTADIMHNATYNVPVYCDGTNWIAMVGARTHYPNAVEFNGTNDHLIRNTHLNSATPTKQVTMSYWVNLNANTRGDIISSPALRNIMPLDGINDHTVYLYNSSGTTVFSGRTINSLIYSENTWQHFLISIDVENSVVSYYKNDTVASFNGSLSFNDDFINTAHNDDIFIGCEGSSGSCSNYFQGYLSEFWLHYGIYMDFSVEANRRKFIDADGYPVYLGANGERPIGNAPDIYLSGDTADWHTNKGTGGGFTENGELTTAPTTPTSKTNIVPSGLVGHWRLDETSGTTAFDSSGNGNDGTMYGSLESGGTSTSGIIGNAMDFPDDNGSSYVDISSVNLSSANNLTITAWIRPSDMTTRQEIVFQRTAEAEGIGVNSNGELRYHWNNNPSIYNFSSGLFPVLGEWSFIALTVTPTAGKMYLGDRQKLRSATRTLTHNPVDVSGFNIGRDSGLTDRDFIGLIDDVRVYDRALDEDEIVEIYEARDGVRYNNAYRVPEYFDGNKFTPMRPTFPDVTDGLVGHWKLDETSGTTAVDSSGNGNDGAFSSSVYANIQEVAATGPSAGAYDFKLQRAHVAIPHDASLNTTNVTISAWAKFNFNNATNRIVTKNNDYQLEVQPINRRLILKKENTVAPFFSFPDNPLEDRWYHVAASFDDAADAIRYYVDGVYLGSTTGYTETFDQDTQVVHLGEDGPRNALALDDVRIYERVLSDIEVQTIYNLGTPIGQATALPLGCPNIGDVCDDGTVYAGLSPDGSVEMFTTPKDAANQCWNACNGVGTYTLTNVTSLSDGDANTRALVTIDADSATSGFQTHDAAQYCFDLSAHGSDDWYLPARDEGYLFHLSQETGAFAGTFTTGNYLNSTEADQERSATMQIDDGTFYGNPKAGLRKMRCVRKGPAPRCANPYGLEGQMVFNTNGNVVQYCDGARWIAIGKRAP